MRVESVKGDVCVIEVTLSVRSAGLITRREGRTLADEEADADAAHVETVEELLDRETDPIRLFAVLPLKNTPAAGERDPGVSWSAEAYSDFEKTHATVMTVGSCRVLIF